MVKHLVVNYRDRLVGLSYLPTFRDIILGYDQTQGYTTNVDYYIESEEELGKRPPPGTRLMEQISLDPQEEYWNTSDPEDQDDGHHGEAAAMASSTNGCTTPSRPLVDYPSDEDSDENVNPEAEAKAKEDGSGFWTRLDAPTGQHPGALPVVAPPLERVSEKRRREEDEEDELGKLMHHKCRSSSSSESNAGLTRTVARRRSLTSNLGNGPPRKISISLSHAVKTGVGDRPDEEA